MSRSGAIFLVAEPDGKARQSVQRHLPACRLFGRFSAGQGVLFVSLPHQRVRSEGEAISAVPPRGMDSLECEIRGSGEIWVKYEDFLTGTSEKIRKA